MSSADSTVRVGNDVMAGQLRSQSCVQYGSIAGDYGANKSSSSLAPKPATHDISRASYHVKNVGSFAQSLEEVSSTVPDPVPSLASRY
jgi:hypothetical protein